LILHPVFLKQENNHLRGKMPGLMWIHNNSPSFNHLEVVTDVVGYPGSKFLLVKVGSANGYYQELGMLAFDITGPWW
jgi:isocitrate lyase